MIRRLAILAALLVPVVAGAQVVPRRPTRADSLRADSLARRDTLPRDSVLVKWTEPDSVMQALLNKPGYVVTRYEGVTVIFDAQGRAFEIVAGPGGIAAVQRGTQTAVTDTSIVYDEDTKVATIRGARIVLSDPSSQQADLVASGLVQYNLAQRSALVTNPRFPVSTGETWYVNADIARMVTDSSTGAQFFYGRHGTITSCQDSLPHYHFQTGEIKKTGNNTIVARPAVLYIGDIPVLWLPFIFQDTRGGRRSGVLTPQFGIADIVRNSPNYRRRVEDLGYYFAISDYMDARVAVDWLSNAGADEGDLPGYVKMKGEWGYNWLERYLQGRLASDYTRSRGGESNLAVSWNHQQEFSRNSRLTLNANYVTSTQLQRQTSINPWTAVATIRSSANYSHRLGPANLQLGGTRTQYPGRDQVDQTLPTLSINTGPLNLASWLVWTPNFSYTLSQQLAIDAPAPLSTRFVLRPDGGIDSIRLKRNSSTSSMSFDTPIRIFGTDIRNGFRVSDDRRDYPQRVDIALPGGGTETRIFSRYHQTTIDWNPDVQLPSFANARFKLTPSVSLQNVAPGPFWIRNVFTGGRFVSQNKRPTFSLNAGPTIFGFFPGFGPFERLRHSVNPTLTYSYAPALRPSEEFLRASNLTSTSLLGLRQQALTFGLSQNVEAKVRTQGDTTGEATGEKITLLSLQFTPLSYDFERAKKAGKAIRGLTTDRFSYTLASDLVPNFSLQMDYSLFEGSAYSDTARFKPYREGVSARISFSKEQNPFTIFSRLFGRAVPAREPMTEPQQETDDQELQQQIASQPVAGSRMSGRQFIVPPASGWSASFSFSSQRPRPPRTGPNSNVQDFDPALRCEPLRPVNPIVYEQCLLEAQTTPTADVPPTAPIAGGTIYRLPATTSITAQTAFRVTERWSASWQTNFDVERSEFASHIVSLQRELHDWRAVFGFTQSPNGSFAFSFFISLKAEPDLKFDYNRATYRQGR